MAAHTRVLLVLLLAAALIASSTAQTCSKSAAYFYVEKATCASDCQCIGMRTCSASGVCEGIQNPLTLPLNCTKGPDYYFDESVKGNRCYTDCDCTGERTCSGSAWCQGVAVTKYPPCGPGEYEGSTRGYVDRNIQDGICLLCTNGQWYPDNGGSCVTCNGQTVLARKPDGSSFCACKPGWVGLVLNPSICPSAASIDTSGGQACCTIKCGYGFYSPGGDLAACLACPADSVSGLGASSCTNCTASGKVPYKGAKCVCPAGAQPDGAGGCSACPAGTSKKAAGDVACTPCAAGFVAAPGAAVCVKCTNTTTTPAADGASCSCLPGAFGPPAVSTKNAATCAYCPAGTFSSGGDATECTPCPPGEGAPKGSAACAPCQTGTVLVNGACVCDVGTQPDGAGGCAPCPVGTYKSAPSNKACPVCAVGKISATPGAVKCTTCDTKTATSNTERTECVCKPGSTPPVAPNSKGLPACQPCAVGTYGLDGLTCAACPGAPADLEAAWGPMYPVSAAGSPSAAACSLCLVYNTEYIARNSATTKALALGTCVCQGGITNWTRNAVVDGVLDTTTNVTLDLTQAPVINVQRCTTCLANYVGNGNGDCLRCPRDKTAPAGLDAYVYNFDACVPIVR